MSTDQGVCWPWSCIYNWQSSTNLYGTNPWNSYYISDSNKMSLNGVGGSLSNTGGGVQPTSSSVIYTYECIVDVDAVDSVTALGNTIQAQGFQANYVDKQVPGLTGHLEGVQVTAAYVALLVIVLCALSVGNQVSSSVRQRRSELGIMLAIGFRQRMLAGMVAGEALATGVAGALVGIGIAIGGIAIFGALQPSAGAAIPWASLPAVVGLSGVLCLIAGILPARRVMRLDCVTAIRAE
jgi:ABC-type antimicrobial peptide transport system permease subunit